MHWIWARACRGCGDTFPLHYHTGGCERCQSTGEVAGRGSACRHFYSTVRPGTCAVRPCLSSVCVVMSCQPPAVIRECLLYRQIQTKRNVCGHTFFSTVHVPHYDSLYGGLGVWVCCLVIWDMLLDLRNPPLTFWDSNPQLWASCIF